MEPDSSLVEEKTGECALEANALLQMYDSIVNIYAQRTGKPSSQIAKDMKREAWYMSAEEAQAHGIVDSVADSFELVFNR